MNSILPKIIAFAFITCNHLQALSATSRKLTASHAKRPNSGVLARVQGKILAMISKKEANDEDIKELHAAMEKHYPIGVNDNNYNQLRRIYGAMFKPEPIFIIILEKNTSSISSSFRKYLVDLIFDGYTYDEEAKEMDENCWFQRIRKWSKLKFEDKVEAWQWIMSQVNQWLDEDIPAERR